MARFRPGVSGNPGGRPRGQSEAGRLARQYSGHAVFALARLACDARATPKLQLRAACELLLRGYGPIRRPRAPDATARSASAQKACQQEEDVGRYGGLARSIRDILVQLDADHSRLRRILMAELEELEREEGVTVTVVSPHPP